MRFHRLILALLTLCAFTAARAQRALVWQPDTTLRVVTQMLFDSVIIDDLRRDQSAIGWLKTGALNRYADLVTEDSVSTTLAAYATHLLRGTDASLGVLLVVLRDFRVEDRKGGEEIGTVHVHADLFRGVGNNGEYFHLRSFDTLYETKSGWDVTKGVQKLASQAVLDLVNAGALAKPTGNTLYTRAGAAVREDEAKATWPLYTEASPPRGVYHSFDDLLHLNTTDTSFIDVRVASPDGPTTWYFHRKNNRGKKGDRIQPGECLAIFDGKLWHVSHPRGFSVMKREGSDFYATLFMRGFTDNSVVMGVLFGVAGSIAAANDMSLRYTPYRSRLAPEVQSFLPIKRVR